MKEREEETVFSVWVNWNRRMISFSPDDGFEELIFQTYEEKFRFAIEKENEGFGIQQGESTWILNNILQQLQQQVAMKPVL